MAEEVHEGLEGVVVTESVLSHIDGEAGRLIYRGHAIEDLAREASYEEVLYLLWHGTLPDATALEAFETSMAGQRAIDDGVMETARTLAEADEAPMSALRTLVSSLSAFVTDAGETVDEATNRRKGQRITAKLPTALAAFERARRGEEIVPPREDLGHAANFLYMLNGEAPDEVMAETFDMALVLHADHGLNASTFSSMVTASTLADMHAAVTSAVGTLSGSLHGGANQAVMELLIELDEAGADPVAFVEERLAEGQRIPGFGHRVYRVKDPRARILGEKSAELGDAGGDAKWYDYSVAIEEHLQAEKGLAPNVDFYSASTYYQMGIPVDLYTPIFALSRVGGWVAHVLEQYDGNRLIRPRAKYVGPESATFVPLAER